MTYDAGKLCLGICRIYSEKPQVAEDRCREACTYLPLDRVNLVLEREAYGVVNSSRRGCLLNRRFLGGSS